MDQWTQQFSSQMPATLKATNRKDSTEEDIWRQGPPSDTKLIDEAAF